MHVKSKQVCEHICYNNASKNKKAANKKKGETSCQETEGKKCSGFSEADTHVRQRSYLRGFPAGQHLAVALCSQWMYHHSSGENTLASRSWCILLIWERDWKGLLSYRRQNKNNLWQSNKRFSEGFCSRTNRNWETSPAFTFAKCWQMHSHFVYIVVSWLMTKLCCPFSFCFNSQRCNPFPAI